MTKIIAIKSIVIDGGTQARAAINEEVVTEYAERMAQGDKFPPVIVFHDGSRYHLADGFHRTLAAARNKQASIESDVRQGTLDDAVWFALGANRNNGQRLTRADVRHAVELALKRWPDKTQAAIAEQVGCVQQFVSRVQNELTTSGKLTPPSTRKGADGKEYPTTYAKRTPMPTNPPKPSPMPEAPRSEPPKPIVAPRTVQLTGSTPTTLYTDCVGRQIPAWLNPIWEAREAIESHIATLKGIRFSIETRHKEQDKAYLRITAVTLAKIQHVEGELKDAMPYAVCPVCQGVEGGCKCCTDGFQSEDQWKMTPDRMKSIRR